MAETEYLTAADAARILDVTPGAVRLMEKRDELMAAARTRGGIHLYCPSDVESLRAKRAMRRESGGR